MKFDYDAFGQRIAKHIHKASDNSRISSTYYVRDAQGNIMATYEQKLVSNNVSFLLMERPIYGSSRIAIDADQKEMMRIIFDIPPVYINRKYYELSNHLGNVISVVSDVKYPVGILGGNIQSFKANIVSYNDYMPFSGLMTGRTFSSEKYRFGFNGKENDNKVKGQGNQQDYGMRIYDPRLTRFLSIDPLTSKYAGFTPFSFAINRPIQGIDRDGKDWEPTNTWYGKLSDKSKKFAEKNGIYTESMTYVDLWKVMGPDLICQTQYSQQKTDCADVSIKSLLQFSEMFKLPVKIGSVSNETKGTLDKVVKKAQIETGAEQIFDGRGTTSGTKFTKEMFDKDPIETETKMRQAFSELTPGDLVTWNHTAIGQSGHNITVTDVHPESGSIETIQGQPGEIPKWDDKDIETMINQVKSGTDEIKFQKWNFKDFDKEKTKKK